MSQWQSQPDVAASRRQHRQLYQAQGRYLRFVGLLTLAGLLYYVWFFTQFGISGEQLTSGLQQIGRYLLRMFVWHDFSTGRLPTISRRSASLWRLSSSGP
jgi:phosphonate transport system permease protein